LGLQILYNFLIHNQIDYRHYNDINDEGSDEVSSTKDMLSRKYPRALVVGFGCSLFYKRLNFLLIHFTNHNHMVNWKIIDKCVKNYLCCLLEQGPRNGLHGWHKSMVVQHQHLFMEFPNLISYLMSQAIQVQGIEDDLKSRDQIQKLLRENFIHAHEGICLSLLGRACILGLRLCTPLFASILTIITTRCSLSRLSSMLGKLLTSLIFHLRHIYILYSMFCASKRTRIKQNKPTKFVASH